MDLLTLSLFSGAGGLDLGFSLEGFRTLLAADIDQASVETFKHSFRDCEVIKCDLASEDARFFILERLGVLLGSCRNRAVLGVLGGPPCQGFSAMNVGNDPGHPRNQLVFQYAAILSDASARFGLDFFVFENVPALLCNKHRSHFERALRLFSDAGFNVTWDVLNAVDFGVAQHRKRVFVVGVNTRYKKAFDFNLIERSSQRLTVRDVIADLPPLDESNGYNRSDYHPNHRCMVPKSHKIREVEPGDVKRKSFKRLAWNGVSPTIAYGHNEVHIHPAKGEQDRRLSTLEALLLQGFPREAVLKGTMTDWHRLVSESVSPPVARAIANTLKDQILDGCSAVLSRGVRLCPQ